LGELPDVSSGLAHRREFHRHYVPQRPQAELKYVQSRMNASGQLRNLNFVEYFSNEQNLVNKYILELTVSAVRWRHLAHGRGVFGKIALLMLC